MMAGHLTLLTHRRLAQGFTCLLRGALEAACGRVANATPGYPQYRHLARSRHGLRVGVQVRRLGRQPDEGMACPLWRSRRDDLLACLKGLDLHFLAAQALFVFGGRRDDQGRAATLHQRGDSGPLPPARVHLPPRLKAIARQKLAPSGLRAELPNLLPILSNVIN